jgi:hypothetical protein
MDAAVEETEEQERILSDNPLLMSEPAWNPSKAREKTIELAMEDWNVPAFFLAKTGQLAAYVELNTRCKAGEADHTYLQVLPRKGHRFDRRRWSSEYLSNSLVRRHGATERSNGHI